MTIESMPKEIFWIRQNTLEIVSELLCVTNCKRHSDCPLTFFIRISMIDSSIWWYSSNWLAFHACIPLSVSLSIYRIFHFYISSTVYKYIFLAVKSKTYRSCETTEWWLQVLWTLVCLFSLILESDSMFYLLWFLKFSINWGQSLFLLLHCFLLILFRTSLLTSSFYSSSLIISKSTTD